MTDDRPTLLERYGQQPIGIIVRGLHERTEATKAILAVAMGRVPDRPDIAAALMHPDRVRRTVEFAVYVEGHSFADSERLRLQEDPRHRRLMKQSILVREFRVRAEKKVQELEASLNLQAHQNDPRDAERFARRMLIKLFKEESAAIYQSLAEQAGLPEESYWRARRPKKFSDQIEHGIDAGMIPDDPGTEPYRLRRLSDTEFSAAIGDHARAPDDPTGAFGHMTVVSRWEAGLSALMDQVGRHAAVDASRNFLRVDYPSMTTDAAFRTIKARRFLASLRYRAKCCHHALSKAKRDYVRLSDTYSEPWVKLAEQMQDEIVKRHPDVMRRSRELTAQYTEPGKPNTLLREYDENRERAKLITHIIDTIRTEGLA